MCKALTLYYAKLYIGCHRPCNTSLLLDVSKNLCGYTNSIRAAATVSKAFNLIGGFNYMSKRGDLV